ncbi:MAG: hypothetical protein M1150_03830 [Patescibacteria group bacterium]|nr:hypothetical protein [Patescibacteria group bacterium]
MPDKIIATTQEHLDIEDIRNDIVVLKSGNASIVLQTNAVNFDLLSEQEQDAMIFAYAGLLNSLSFPIQVIVRSKLMDISSYIEKLETVKKGQANQRLAEEIGRYQEFVRELIAKNNVLDKRFYIVIPYFEARMSSLSPIGALTGKKTVYFDKWQLLEKAKVALQPKRDHIIKQLSRIGVKAKQVTTQELVELFYDIYNPTVAREQKVALKTSDYTTPVVEPAIEPAGVVENAKPQPIPNNQTENPRPAEEETNLT